MNSSSLAPLLSFSQGNHFSIDFFQWDSWSQLFVVLILGIGILIGIHAWAYFENKASKLKFFAVLLPFAAAMTGVVVFNHLILFYIAWELTSILSYFLITFNGESSEARRGGQHSLLITGIGGLCLLGGILLLGSTTGAWTFSSALEVDLSTHPQGGWIVGLILMGALTKSAQFPFHFWLSGAMTAPTPASAYLHSATMVKAGIYLLYRLWPMLETIEWASLIVFTLGIITFAWGTFFSLLQLDLKGVLAGTTVAHLGLMAAMIAWEDQDLSLALSALVLSHATYKAGLFLFSGVVEKLTGTRRIDRMSGLKKSHPFIFGIGIILAGASLGLPGTLAYHSKSLMHLPMEWKIALTLVFLILGKAGLLVAIRPFLGDPQPKLSPRNDNLILMWLSPLLLGLLSWGAVPMRLVKGTDWSSLNLIMAVVAAAIAVALLRRWTPAFTAALNRGPWIPAADIFDSAWYTHLDFAKVLREIVQPATLTQHVLIVMTTFSAGVLSLSFFLDLPAQVNWTAKISLTDVFVWLCLGKIVATLFVLRTEKPIQSVLFLGLTGYLFAVTLALAGAPDLAMTQFSVETLSVLVLLYALKGVGPLKPQTFRVKASGIAISVFSGVAVALATGMASLSTTESRLRSFFAESSWLEAHGRNVVNVILVDYRALDTLGEITVLGVATLGIFLLVSTMSTGREQ